MESLLLDTHALPGVLAGRISLPPIEELLEPLPEDELACLEQPLP